MKLHRMRTALAGAFIVAVGACEEGPTAIVDSPQHGMHPSESTSFVEVQSESFGRFEGKAYVRVTGRFEGTTAQGPFRVPFEIVVPEEDHVGNGTLLVEPPHFAQRFSGRDDYLGRGFLFDRGYRWASVGWSQFGQSVLDPTATDILISGGQDDGIVLAFIDALKTHPDARDIVGPFERTYGYGFSQTSWLMHRLLRSPGGTDLFDFTMLNATWWQAGGFQGNFVPVTGAGKIVIVQAEADLVIADGRVLRNVVPLTDEYRVYEVAGAAHIPDIPANHDNPIFGPGIPGTNPLDWSIVARAGFVAGDVWTRTGAAPSPSVLIEDDPSATPDPVYGFPTGIARDTDLNALGGVRLPEIALGVGRYMAADPGVPVAFLTGSYEDISCSATADGSVRFPSHGAYVSGVRAILNSLRQEGLILTDDDGDLQREAARSDLGGPGSCTG